jgi:hypothetical protein
LPGLGEVLAAAAGEALWLAAAVVSLAFFVLGVADAVGLSDPEGDASFLLERFDLDAVGEALGLSAAAGEAAALEVRLCFAGDGLGLSAGDGLWASAAVTVNAARMARQENFFISADDNQNSSCASIIYSIGSGRRCVFPLSVCSCYSGSYSYSHSGCSRPLRQRIRTGISPINGAGDPPLRRYFGR